MVISLEFLKFSGENGLGILERPLRPVGRHDHVSRLVDNWNLGNG